MLTLVHQNVNGHPYPFSSLAVLLAEPFPQTPEDMLQLEQRLSVAAAQTADQMVLVQLTRAHAAEAFVMQAMAQAHAQSPVPLVHKGFRMTSVLLLGGTRIVIETPYLREDRRGRRGRRRRTRGPRGAGCYPVLEALGIADRVSPATRSEIALHVVQTASYREAAAMLARRGLSCDVSSLVRISTATAEASARLRDAALAAALRVPVPRNGLLAGKRVRVSLDGGRVRIRRTHPGRKTAKGRHGFSTPWREPRLLVIDILDDQGRPDRLRLPLYDVLIGDAEAVWALLIGYLRLLGAAYADVVEFSADGAEWIWHRVERLSRLAEIPAAKLVEALDFYHAINILRDPHYLPPPAQSPTPSAVQALAACATAPGGWGGGGDGGVGHVGHEAAGQGHRACRALCEGPCASHALCHPGGAEAPHRVWPGRERGATGGQSTLQGPRVILEGNHRQWADASAGGLQGWTVGRGHEWGIDWHMPHAKF